MMLNMAATLWRIRHLQHSFPCQFFVAVRRICVPITSEHDCKEEKPSMLTKRKLKEEGMQTHAKYHIKVKELTAEFRLKRLEEEKHLNEEQQKKEDIRKFEAETHERVIENINMENKRMQLQRKQRKENEKLLNEQRDRRRMEAKKKIRLKQHQERLEHVRNAIEESKNWVTKENLEEKIAHCLEHETNHNFALSPTGERIYSTSPPGSVDTDENGPGPAAYLTTGLKPAVEHST